MTTLVLLLIDCVSWCFWKLGTKRAIRLGRFLGACVFHVLPIRRRIVLDNLAHAFPEKSDAARKLIARDCYRQLGRILAETLILPRISFDEIDALVRFHDTAAMDAALATGRGVIFCMGHMGNWELLGYGGARRGYKFHAVTKTLKGTLNRRLHETRRKVFGELPPSGSFECGVELLHQGDAVALIIDQHRHGDKAVAIEFFGRRAATSPAPALFAMRAKVPVFAGWMTLGDDDVYDVRFRGPFPVPENLPLAEQLEVHSQTLAADLEATIRTHPAEWFWVHRRWKLAEQEARATQGETA
jgi:KDO2-lipid IV(A) lauroyltransferase